MGRGDSRKTLKMRRRRAQKKLHERLRRKHEAAMAARTKK